MKALSSIVLVFAAFLIFLGFSSKQTAGNALANAVIFCGVLIAGFVIVIWVLVFIKEKREKDDDLNDSDFK